MDAWADQVWAVAATDAPLNVQAATAIQIHWDGLVPDLDEFDSPFASATQDTAPPSSPRPTRPSHTAPKTP